ncbi:hypothetical protein OG978_04875 [Streptomyces sp. NBC_01591]|uniref:hypothetical protein n=1 Tax=Streptomyces sp. NBC_01591 TaxID=2975888 RepID=UPI002DD8B7A0|nr:hypothetical protein [Streptomyces sp. NBC_01591]WSD66771.1 hypothetical protein OG978_04875 [Streptomyces sp. NBC_01591]
MRYPFRAGAVVVALTAALAACGSSAEGHKGASGAGPSATRAPLAAPSAGPGTTASGGPSAPPTSEPPKLPKDELTPASGSFTRKQKEYLVDRVPRGMDPAAVLQTGQETCDRLRFLVKADRDVAVGAIVTGEIADAEPAVEHLCTQHRGLLREAARGYADGTYRNDQIRPGRYHDVSPTGDCTWRITGADGRTLVSGSASASKRATINVPQQARAFTSTGCYAWLPEGDLG